ncbi:kynurenine formamidase [Planococcus citri]|uniref:kynurenine formamidase n=1 Tax=Planococcus citri TaxID=170843 RepID=UPI0031F7B6D8
MFLFHFNFSCEMEGIEKLYTPSQWCSYRCDPHTVVEEHVKAVTKESLKVTEEISFIQNLRYGNGPKQVLDLFEPENVSDAIPTFIYIHGGYWQELSRDISRYCVKPLIQSNIRVIIPGYDLVPQVDMRTIIKEIEDLAAFINKLAQDRHWTNIWYGGHSAGAHLAASLLCSGNFSNLNIAGLILISGIYNLEPLIRTTINEKLNINNENYRSLSPLLRLPKSINQNIRISIFIAEYDSPAFHTQSENFKREVEKLHSNVELNVIKNTDHFTIVENLKNTDFILTKTIINMILCNNSKLR